MEKVVITHRHMYSQNTTSSQIQKSRKTNISLLTNLAKELVPSSGRNSIQHQRK